MSPVSRTVTAHISVELVANHQQTTRKASLALLMKLLSGFVSVPQCSSGGGFLQVYNLLDSHLIFWTHQVQKDKTLHCTAGPAHSWCFYGSIRIHGNISSPIAYTIRKQRNCCRLNSRVNYQCSRFISPAMTKYSDKLNLGFISVDNSRLQSTTVAKSGLDLRTTGHIHSQDQKEINARRFICCAQFYFPIHAQSGSPV